LAVFWWKNKVSSFGGSGIGKAFLRFATPFANLRRVPIIGPCVRWASAKILPRDTLTWIQVQSGPGQGIWLHLNPRTGRDYFQGEVEPEVQTALQKHLLPGMTVFDVGSNIGFFALLAAKLVGPQGRVFAFEADPEIAARLREHLTRNAGAPIVAEEKAVWSRSEPLFFARADAGISPDRGLGHVVDAAATNSVNSPATIRVEGTSLDEYIVNSSAPDFIKCDVEGAEVEVFRGAEKLLREKKPTILCEMHSAENRRVLTEQFSRLGYNCQPCGENHILALP
jgi:FkbM family methyltransferase